MGSRFRSAVAAVAVLLGLGLAQAESPADGVKRALGAHAQGDGEALRRVARSEHGDVWRIVGRLLGAGEAEVARAVVTAAAGAPGAERLAAYLAWRAAHPLPRDPWKTIDHVQRLRTQGDGDGARAEMAKAKLPEDGVAGVVQLMIRARLAARPAEALAVGGRAATLAEGMGWTREAASILRAMLVLAARLENHAAALSLAGDLLRLEGPVGDAATRAFAHDQSARASRALGRQDAAIDHATRAWTLAEGDLAKRNALRYLIILEVPAAPRHRLRDHLLTLRALEQRLDDPAGVMATDVRLASLEARTGRWASAVQRIARALEYIEEYGSAWQRRGTHLNAAHIANQMLDGDRALDHVRAARHAGAGLGLDDTDLIFIEGTARSLRGEYAASEMVFLKGLPGLARRTARARAGLRLHVAHTQALAGHREAALATLEATRADVESAGDPELTASFLATRSFVELAMGKIEDALRTAQDARRLAEELELRQLSSVIEVRLAEAWLRRGEAARAWAHVDRAIDLILRRSAALPDRLGAQYRAELRNTFALAIESAVQTKDAARFFAAAERARSVALRQQLGAQTEAVDALDPELRERELALREAETDAMRAYRRAVRATDTDRTREAYAELGRVRERVDRHRERIHAKNAAAGQLVDPRIDTLEATQARLDATEAQVHIALGRNGVFGLVVTPKQARLVALGTRAALRELLDAATLEDATAPWKPTWTELAKRLVKPLGIPEAVTHLTIVPAAQLELVPFAALWPEKILTLVPSTTIGRLLEEGQTGAGRHVLAVGDPAGEGVPRLPAAAREADRIGDVTIKGVAATERALRNALATQPRWRALHFAGHGLVDPRHPLRSSLALAAEGSDDGHWRVAEILAARVPADLVVLAACSSAQGRTFEQEGRVGFVHAFFVAGATRVLASLWDVDDRATEALMGRFYDALRAGAAPAEALRSAQGWMRGQPKWRHPAHWAGWQLWGP